MGFCRGDQVEVCSKEEGFLGSYYAATVIAQIVNNLYIVQYKNLLKEDESGPLREIVPAVEVRPLPPKTQLSSGFSMHDRVDAFDNDGWWVGDITGKKGNKYYVYFDTTKDEIAYSVSQLRAHLEWVNGNWVCSKKKRVLKHKG